MTALLAALARELFGWSLVGLRAFTILASAGTVLVGALVARELGATRRAQTLAAVMVGFAPGMLATNLLFQPVALDQLTTMLVLWLALRLALGRGSWPLLGVAAGIGLETKYTLAVVLVLLVASFLVWRRDVLRSWGFPLAVAIAAALLVPNLVWEAAHGWTSVHWFLDPPPSGSDETRPQFVVNLILLTAVAFPVAVAGVVSLVRNRALRPLGWTVVGTVVAYFVLGESRTTPAGGPLRARRRCDPARSGDLAPSWPAPCSRRSACSSCRSRCRCCRCARPSGTESSRRGTTTSRRSAGPRTCAWSSGTRAAPT